MEKRQPILSWRALLHPFARRKDFQEYYDYSLLAVVIVLTCFGLIMLYSTTAYTSRVADGDDMFFFTKQAIISVVCLVLAIGISQADYHLLGVVHTPAYFLAILLMFLVKTPLGITANGATRWVGVGPISFQPAEFAKLAVIISVSCLVIRMARNPDNIINILILLLLGGIQFVIAWKVTDNLSTGIIILAITFGLIFIAHPKTKPFIILILIVLVVAIAYVYILQATAPEDINEMKFRQRRIVVWLHPDEYASGYGYQTLQALYAIGSGGFFGRGLGNSIQKLGSIPEAQNDMIFAIVCEELGVFGAILMLTLFGYLLYRLLFIARNAADLFGTLLVSGVFMHIALQVILNISVVLNIIPNTGVTLPFISYGGTSILFLMAEMGIALGVSRQIRFEGSLYA